MARKKAYVSMTRTIQVCYTAWFKSRLTFKWCWCNRTLLSNSMRTEWGRIGTAAVSNLVTRYLVYPSAGHIRPAYFSHVDYFCRFRIRQWGETASKPGVEPDLRQSILFGIMNVLNSTKRERSAGLKQTGRVPHVYSQICFLYWCIFAVVYFWGQMGSPSVDCVTYDFQCI